MSTIESTSNNQTGDVELPLPEVHFRKMQLGSRATFHRWRHQGLPFLKVGSRIFIRPSDLAKFLAKMSKPSGGVDTAAREELL